MTLGNYFYPRGQKRFEIRFDQPQAGHNLMVYDHELGDYLRRGTGGPKEPPHNFTREAAKARIDFMIRNAPKRSDRRMV